MRAIYSSSSTFIRSIVAIVLGLIFVIYPEEINSTIITILGIILLFPLVVSIVSALVNKKGDKSPLRLLPMLGGSGSAVLGLLMIIMPNTFTSLLALFIGLLMFIAGITQIAGILPYSRQYKRYWLLLVPVLTAGIGLYTIINFTSMAKILWILTGVMIILYGVSEIINFFSIKLMLEKNSNVEDAEIIK